MCHAARLSLAIERIESARRYTLELLTDIPDEHWYEMPGVAETNVAWQVGHLAVAEYALLLARRRGAQPEDQEVMTRVFRRRYAKGSQAMADPTGQPNPTEIRQVLTAVHERAISELASEEPGRLAETLAAPHEMFTTLFGALDFCSAHEMLHAGQIGLLRRMLGHAPLR